LACGLVFLNPQPSDETLDQVYSESYFLDAASPLLEPHFGQLKRATARLYLDAVKSYGSLAAGKLLEVGCGQGHLLAEAMGRGFEVTGLDVSLNAVKQANERLGSSVVRCGTIEDSQLPMHYFDVCVCADVIEHVRNPVDFLSHAHRILKPGGVLLVVTPSLDSWSAKVLKKQWFEFKKEHLFYFSRSSLDNTLVRTGFRGVRMEPAQKVLSLEYISCHFERFPVPFVGAATSLLNYVATSALRRKPAPIFTSSVLALARSGVYRTRPLVSVIVPVFNEHKTVGTVLESLRAKELEGLDKEVIVVEGNSTDGTRSIISAYAEDPDFKIVLLDRNRGKGYAVRQGFKIAMGEFLLIQDADLEYDIDDYDDLLEPLRTYREAFVLGVRHGRGNKIRVFANQLALQIALNAGHVLLTMFFNLLFWRRLKDPWTMYKVFRRDCLAGLMFECNRFNFDVELMAKLSRKGYHPVEIPVRYRSRTFHEGKKIKVLVDPWTWFWACLKYRVVSPYLRKSDAEVITREEQIPEAADAVEVVRSPLDGLGVEK
jgi:glycosyltransferase involved in cell wall biosynthesis/SAM-dependent methyltransferase